LLRSVSAPRHRRRFPQLTSAHVTLLENHDYGSDFDYDDESNDDEEAALMSSTNGNDGLSEAQIWPVPAALRLTKCGKCNGLRPPRAHHCMVCGRCILKMDHHW